MRGPAILSRLAGVICLALTGQASAADSYVVYLSEYLSGSYYLASIGDKEVAGQALLKPTELRLPRLLRTRGELGNHDVSPDGTLMVFAARIRNNTGWNIYTARLDPANARLTDVTLAIGTNAREEDPRLSWNSTADGYYEIVYKCDGNICVYDSQSQRGSVVLRDNCELWAPSFSPSGTSISYGQRCNDPDKDEVWHYDLRSKVATAIPSGNAGPDRFGHFVYEDTIVFSRSDRNAGTTSLQFATVNNNGVSVQPVRNDSNTSSDDDAYPDRRNTDRIAFIGWERTGWRRGGGYNMYLLDQSSGGKAVRLTEGDPVLAPVIFSP